MNVICYSKAMTQRHLRSSFSQVSPVPPYLTSNKDTYSCVPRSRFCALTTQLTVLCNLALEQRVLSLLRNMGSHHGQHARAQAQRARQMTPSLSSAG